jgi:hypothetical protein
MTTMQQIYDWLKTLTSIIDLDFVFLESEQKTIIDNNQSISSLINPTASTKFDGISRDDTTQVTLFFDKHSQNICSLKSISAYRLLFNKNLLQQLQVNTSVDKCILVLEDSNEQLSIEDANRKPLSEYLIDNNQSVRIRISILIQIIKYDDKQLLKIPISNQNTTIKQILQLTNMPINIYKYLGSNLRKYIYPNDEYISNLKETNFILAKENETCLVSIKMSNELQLIEIDDENNQDQRYITSATIYDVYKQNKIDIEHQYLLYSNDFVPSYDIQLNSFLTTSPIQFTVIEKNLPINVIIRNGQDVVKFNCSDTIDAERLFQIGCQLFNIKKTYYKLMYSDFSIDDHEMTLADIKSAMTETNPSTAEVEFTLVSKATLNASIVYFDQTVTLPCANETQILDIMKEAFAKLQISEDDIDNYKVILLDEEGIQLENDTIMKDVLVLFSSDMATIQLELKKKEDEN